MKVSDIMITNLYKVQSSLSVYETSKLLKNYDVGAILVEENGEFTGIATSKNFIYKVIAEEKDPRTMKIKDIMSSPLIMINGDADLKEALRLLNKYKIKRLVVVDDGEVVGLISYSLLGKNLNKLIK